MKADLRGRLSVIPAGRGSEDRRDWWAAVLIAVVLHSLLFAFLLSAKDSNSEQDRRDRGIMPVSDGAALPLSGMGGPPDEPTVLWIRCDYDVIGRSHRAELQRGRARARGKIGCPRQLPLAMTISTASIKVLYNTRGSLDSIRGDTSFQGKESRNIIAGWNLADLREGREWARSPAFDLNFVRK